MSDTVLVAIVAGMFSLLGGVVTIIPTIIANRKKTQDSIKEYNEKTDRRIEKIQATLDAHIREGEDEQARNQRYRILRFYDEMCEGRNHSESHFEDILDDIDGYKQYCATHPEFRNSRGEVAMEYIKTAYGKVKSKGGFLTHE